jgi:NADH-quinone oxidoreductase subunit L
MGRECFVVFFGKPRDRHAYDHAHESPWVMTLPLVFLAVLSIAGGWGSYIPHFLKPEEHAAHHDTWKGFALLLVPAAGFLLSAKIYLKANPSDAPVKAALGRVWTWVENKYYFDELYAWIIKYVQGTIATLCELFDRWVIQKLGIGGLAGTTSVAGKN